MGQSSSAALSAGRKAKVRQQTRGLGESEAGLSAGEKSGGDKPMTETRRVSRETVEQARSRRPSWRHPYLRWTGNECIINVFNVI